MITEIGCQEGWFVKLVRLGRCICEADNIFGTWFDSHPTNTYFEAKSQVSLIAPNCDHYAQVSLTVLDNFFGCNCQI